MNSGITRQAFIRHRWSLLGTACTQIVGAGVISVMIMATHSIDTSLPLTERRTSAVADVTEAMGIFLGNARFLSLILVGVTMSLAATHQMHDVAMLRSIGATPGQMRRCLARQAVIVSVPSSIVGFVLAIPAGALWMEVLKGNDVVPSAVPFRPVLSALLVAVVVGVITSLIGTMVAVVRPSQLAPARALTETTAGRGPIGRRRITIGVALISAGVVLSAVLSQLSADAANSAGLFILLSGCVGVGLLGPMILDTIVRWLRPLVGDGHGRLALDDLAAMSRPLSGALIPIVLSISFAIIQDGMLATAARATGVENSSERLMTFSGTASMVLFAAVAALNSLVTVAVGRRRQLATMQLVGGSKHGVLRIKWIQTAVFATTALVIAGGIALATLIPLAASEYGRWLPYLPPSSIALAVVAVAALTAAGVVAPAIAQTRQPAIAAVRTDV